MVSFYVDFSKLVRVWCILSLEKSGETPSPGACTTSSCVHFSTCVTYRLVWGCGHKHQ